MITNGIQLNSIVENVEPLLKQIVESDYRDKPDPKKWSKIEILGHLIDSANNNHRRFVIAKFDDVLVFDGYRQEEWVASQDYQAADWDFLIDFWANYNRLIARLVDSIPDEVLTKEHLEHRLDKMAWKTIPANASATLDYLIKDYIGHLEHHVRQILPAYEPIMIGTYENPGPV